MLREMSDKKALQQQEKQKDQKQFKKDIEHMEKKFAVKDAYLESIIKGVNEKYEKWHKYHHKKGDDGLFVYPNQNVMMRDKDKYVALRAEIGKREQSAKFRQTLQARGNVHNKLKKEVLDYNKKINSFQKTHFANVKLSKLDGTFRGSFITDNSPADMKTSVFVQTKLAPPQLSPIDHEKIIQK